MPNIKPMPNGFSFETTPQVTLAVRASVKLMRDFNKFLGYAHFYRVGDSGGCPSQDWSDTDTFWTTLPIEQAEKAVAWLKEHGVEQER